MLSKQKKSVVLRHIYTHFLYIIMYIVELYLWSLLHYENKTSLYTSFFNIHTN